MDKEKDKVQRILATAHWDGRDDADPAVREALAWARRDPELSAWLEAERALDREISHHLRTVPVPASLREEILDTVAAAKIVPISRGTASAGPLWRRPTVWALAACFLVLAAAAAGWKQFFAPPSLSAATYADMRHDVGSLVAAGAFKPAQEVADLGQARQWLAQKEVPTVDDLPPFLNGVPVVACSVLEWRGRRVGGVCFEKDGGLMHLFVIRREQLDDLPPDGQVLTASFGGHQTLAWNSPRNFFVLVGDQESTDLGRLLHGG